MENADKKDIEFLTTLPQKIMQFTAKELMKYEEIKGEKIHSNYLLQTFLNTYWKCMHIIIKGMKNDNYSEEEIMKQYDSMLQFSDAIRKYHETKLMEYIKKSANG